MVQIIWSCLVNCCVRLDLSCCLQKTLVCKECLILTAGFDNAGTFQHVLASSERPQNITLESSSIRSEVFREKNAQWLTSRPRNSQWLWQTPRSTDWGLFFRLELQLVIYCKGFHISPHEKYLTSQTPIEMFQVANTSRLTLMTCIQTKTAGPPCDQLATSSGSSCSSFTSPSSYSSKSSSSSSSSFSSSEPKTLVGGVPFAFAFAFPFPLARALGFALASALLFSAAWPHAS